MEIKIKDDRFFVVDTGKDKWIYETENDAIEALKSLVNKETSLNPEDMSILEVITVEEQWQIKPVPWSKIALSLLKGA